MKKYFWQENNHEVEILLETDDGFSWICDCGSYNNNYSIEKAESIVRLLNENLAG